MWSAVRGMMTSNGWALSSIIALVLALVMTLLYLLSSTVALRKTAFFVAITLIFIFVLTTALAISQRRVFEQSSEAVILCNDIISVHASPDSSSKVIRQPSQGVTVRELRTHGEWSEIAFADGEKGWIRSAKLEHI
jgi:predicted membrane-bound spermidine synthase